MRLNPLSLMGGAYADNSLTWSAQRTLNWLPETAEVEGTRTPIKFADPPGLRSVVDLGTNAPIRGIENVEGTLFVVSGTSLFEIASDFTATNRGNIPGVGRVSMAHNKQGGATAANQLAIANGLSGYVYNTSTNVLSQITDESFEGASTVDYIDGFITFTDPQGRFWGHSALNQAGEYSTIDRYDAESAPDPIRSHIASHRESIVFGTRTTEFFRNTGAATNTFQRVDGTELEVGICSTFARARVDNSVCWVSDSLEVFRLEGHSPQRISTRPIEQLLHTVNPANIFAFSWEDRGHKVFYITAPEAFTLGFDFASGMWHERQTFDLPRWRVNALASWNNQWIAGDYTNGLLYVLDWDTHHENGLELIRERASGYTHGGQNKVLAPYVELLFDTGAEDPAPLTIAGDLPNGMVGQAVSFSYIASGGIPARVFSLLSGALPTGLTLSGSGAVTGTPTTPGSFSWTVRVTDSVGATADLADSNTISTAFFIADSDTTGIVFKSSNGTTWSDSNTVNTGTGATASISLMFSGAGKVFALKATGGIGRVSSDGGVTWQSCTGLQATSSPKAMVRSNSNFIIVNGTSSGGARISTDGVTFSPSAFPVDRSTAGMATDGSTVIVMTTATVVIRSINGGSTWAEYSDALLTGSPVATFGVGLFVACDVTSKRIYTSATGANGTWTLRTNPIVAATTCQAVHFGNGAFVAVYAGGQVIRSTDGINWTQVATLAAAGIQMTFASGLFIAVGTTGSIFTSADGITWASNARPSTMGPVGALTGLMA